MNIGHNTDKSPEEIREEQGFLDAFNQIKAANSEIASLKGDMSGVYGRLKNLGWTKADIKFAQSLEDKDVGQIIADFERKLRIAKMFGHRLGRQVEMFQEDKASDEDRAYEEGLAAGRMRKENRNPFDPGSEAGQSWQKGFNEGSALANQELDDAVGDSDD